jgi:hypothetical protein
MTLARVVVTAVREPAEDVAAQLSRNPSYPLLISSTKRAPSGPSEVTSYVTVTSVSSGDANRAQVTLIVPAIRSGTTRA